MSFWQSLCYKGPAGAFKVWPSGASRSQHKAAFSLESPGLISVTFGLPDASDSTHRAVFGPQPEPSSLLQTHLRPLLHFYILWTTIPCPCSVNLLHFPKSWLTLAGFGVKYSGWEDKADKTTSVNKEERMPGVWAPYRMKYKQPNCVSLCPPTNLNIINK